MLSLHILRTQEQGSYMQSFSVGASRVTTLLSALYEIRSTIDASLLFDSSCRSGVCGSCAVVVNGKEQLSCSYMVADGDRVEPLKYHKVRRDLKVTKTTADSSMNSILNKISLPESDMLKDGVDSTVQSDCILCHSCYSSCPVLAVNPNFIGPFALTRAYRYTQVLQSDEKIVEHIQSDGIWDCTLCGECTVACPQGIDPKGDILMLRSLSAKKGYSDPNFGNMDFGGGDFGFNSFEF